MIAVFCKYQRDFDELIFTPKNILKRIKNAESVFGARFDGVIRMYDWYNGDKELLNAYDVLMARQPELFKQ